MPALLGRRQPQQLPPLRTSLLVLAALDAGATGAVTAAGTVTAGRSDGGASTGAVTAAGTVTASAVTSVTGAASGAVTAVGAVSGLASIPSVPIRRGPFGRT